MPDPTDLLPIAQRLQALAQAGLAYQPNPFDTERYQEIHSLSMQLLANLSGEPIAALDALFANETGYPTPKVDVRAVIFRGPDEILLVQEKIDGNRWSLPGGWADVGYTPFEVAVKEVREETGLETQAVRLLALLDKKQHQHPPAALVRVQSLRAVPRNRRQHPAPHDRNRRRALGASE